MRTHHPQTLHDCLAGFGPDERHAELLHLIDTAWHKAEQHGDYARWSEALARLPERTPSSVDLASDTVRIGQPDELDAESRNQMLQSLQELHPWRKGPFDFFGIKIDTEWRSDWKWNRLKHAITPLAGRYVLDVGCGSGYHCWRMLGAGAAKVVGIDPTLLFTMQFQACQHYIADERVQFWPIGIDELPRQMGCFDSIFSMGILYHRRSPIDHLLQLKSLLCPGGELVLETLVVAGEADRCLIPNGRYAKMRNVWFIPSVAMLENWMGRAGFRHIKIIDVSVTTMDEQRRTDWMHFESLADYLDRGNPTLTVEGHPAPIRAILTGSI